MNKLYYLDPGDIPCTLERLVTSRPLSETHQKKLISLECGERVEILWPGETYGDEIVCCGSERHVTVHDTLRESGVLSSLSDDEAWSLVRQLIENVDKVQHGQSIPQER